MIADYIPLNLALMRHPMNWVIVAVIVMFWGMALHVIAQASTGALMPVTDNDPSTGA